MTKQTKKALQTLGVKLGWDGKRYFVRIGYQRIDGERVRKFFHLGSDLQIAIAKAVTLRQQWRELKAKAPVGLKGAVCWPKDTLPKMTQAETAQEVQRVLDEATDDMVEEVPTLRLEQVKEMYLEYRKGKIGIGGGEGLKQSTARDEANNLKLAFGYIDPKAVINSLGYAEIEQWKDKIFKRVGEGEGKISKRTAVNYCRAIKAMLDWGHRQANVPYRHCEDYADLFAFRNVNPIRIADYDAEQLKKLLEKASNRQRLYIYLALNCGYYQADIGSLRRDEIVQYNGKWAIVRKRSKTSHQNDFECMHTLWPETYTLLQSEMAERNEWGLALLNEDGKPLYRDGDNGKYDGIKHSYNALQQKSGIPLALKQLRKIGATAMERIGGQQARRLYKAGAVDSGDKVYVKDCYDNLTPHLLQWGEELRKDGVLY